MEVFLSWSGPESRAVARTLRRWLPRILQEVAPWMASEDLGPGGFFANEIVEQLQKTDYGIVCITRDNYTAPWLLFEAGALVNATGKARAVPYLRGINPTDLEPPLRDLQALKATERDTRVLVAELNQRLSRPLDDRLLRTSFDTYWPRIKSELGDLPKPKGQLFCGELFYISNMESGKYLEAVGAAEEEGKDIRLRTFNGHDRQKWKLYRQDDRYFVIESLHTGICVDVEGGANDKSARVHQWPFHGGSNQNWEFTPSRGGAHRLKRKKGQTHSLGTKANCLWQHDEKDSDDQRWWLEVVVV